MRHPQPDMDKATERDAIAKGYDHAADTWVKRGNLSEATLWRNRARAERRAAQNLGGQ